jgi:hemerythrin-like domain-containing protein
MKTTALKLMSAEHRNIEIVIKSLQDAAAALDQCRRLNIQKLRSVVDFLRVYGDERHHQREEALFFPILVKRGVPARGCPIAGLNHEHEKGRALVSSLGEEITFYEQQQPGADQALRQTLQGIIDLYQKHLWMEDVMVFPMAEKLITESDDKELRQKFADLDRKIGLEAIKRSENFARSLCLQTGMSVPAGAKAVTVSADCECDWS